MAYTILKDETGKFIYVKYFSDVTIYERTLACDEVNNELIKNGFRCVFVDFTRAELAIEEPSKQSDFAARLCDSLAIKESRIAFYMKRWQMGNDLVEILSRARHLECAHFTELQKAYQWLTLFDCCEARA